MINLLPPKEKEELLLEKNIKLAIILGSVVLVPLFCLILVLLSLKFYILKEVSFQKVILYDTEKKYQTAEFLSFRELIKKYNNILFKSDAFYKKEIYFSEALKTISKIEKPGKLHLNNVVIEHLKESNKIKVIISGVSDTRENLLTFKENIENNPKIENVYFPPENWIKSTNVNFNLTFEIKPAK